MPAKTKFLTVVWGQSYIERFVSLSLPSFLAPGNLPALAAATELEIVIMTARSDISYFERHDSFKVLNDICNVRFIEIDDLITTSVYGVTLTIAYARAVISCGADMVNTHFIFMNADFVLADGSLQNLSKHILDDRTIVVAPTARVTTETIEPILHTMIDESSHTLAVEPRDMVRHALKNLHPTSLAKIVNQDVFHTLIPNQYFWLVDRHTLLGRYHLIFMLCLKPECMLTRINTYCDYGFIPEMCPSGDITIMDDSDNFFMLELQARDQEMFLLRFGQQSIKDAARNIGTWTTAEHRQMANYNVVFHSRDVPSGLEKTKHEADTFINQIQRKLPSPIPHAFHYHWVQGVQAWKYSRNSQGLSSSPPELDTFPRKLFWMDDRFTNIKHNISFWLINLFSACQRKIIGLKPHVTMLHPDWLDYRFLRGAINSIPRGDATRLLVISARFELIKGFLDEHHHADFVHIKDILKNAHLKSRTNNSPHTHIFIYLSSRDFKQMNRLIEQCQSQLQPNGECLIFAHDIFSNSYISPLILRNIQELSTVSMNSTKNYFVGGKLKYLNKTLLSFLRDCYFHNRNYELIWIVPAVLSVLLSTFVMNLFFIKIFPADFFIGYCSSMLFRFESKPEIQTLKS